MFNPLITMIMQKKFIWKGKKIFVILVKEDRD